jgi:hypothetical protein
MTTIAAIDAMTLTSEIVMIKALDGRAIQVAMPSLL